MSRISIVMTTYNGEKYIYQQLESLLLQTRSPDEVFIRDDQSKDSTVAIIKDFISKYSLKNWNIIQNEENYGWVRNFYEAAKLATGDIIFFSDQDDIWINDKIETMATAMIKNQIGALYGEKDIIDQDGKLNSKRVDKRKYSGRIEQVPFSKAFYSIKTLGCCMCVSRTVVDKYLSLNYPQGGHDSQCGRLAAMYSSLWHIDKPVIHYRIHQNNTSGISSSVPFGASTLEKRIIEIDGCLRWLNILLGDSALDSNMNSIVSGCCKAVEKRSSYLKGLCSFFSLYKYKEYYSNLTMLMGDFAYRHKINHALGKLRWKFRS